MDYEEEQQMELQAVQAIYMDDYKELEGDGTAFELTLVPETGGDNNHVSLTLSVEYTATYPETPPILSCRAVRGLTDEQATECEAMLKEAAASDEMLGNAMVYMLAERAQEWLAERNVPETQDMHSEMLARLQVQQDEAAGGDDDGDGTDAAVGRGRQKRSQGQTDDWRLDPTVNKPIEHGTYTPVTPETFAEWRKEWDERERQRRALALAASLSSKKGGKNEVEATLTGRMLFEKTGSTLHLADAGELKDGEEDVMAGERGGDDDYDDDYDDDGDDDEDADAVLAEVGDSALFDEEELPDDI